MLHRFAFLALAGLSLLAALPTASALAGPCNASVQDDRGLFAIGCQATPGTGGWLAVFYDCWVVGGGDIAAGRGTYAYGVTDDGRIGLPDFNQPLLYRVLYELQLQHIDRC